ncbi:MAG: tetratricopeptide repeat protein [Syntrophaceae bacterium]
MAKKITKKDIEKPDAFQSALSRYTAYVSENKQKIYLVSGVLTLIVIIACAWYLYRMNYEKNAQKLYSTAHLATMQIVMQGSNPDQNTLKMFSDVISQYPGSKAAMMAHFQIGNISYNLGDIDASLKAYEEFLKAAPESEDLKTLAYTGMGYCYEAKSDLKNALDSFEKAAAVKSVGSFESITYRNIARIYEEMKNMEKALEYYQKALNKTKDPSMELLLKRKISTIS